MICRYFNDNVCNVFFVIYYLGIDEIFYSWYLLLIVINIVC